jgi:hypothetical protein
LSFNQYGKCRMDQYGMGMLRVIIQDYLRYCT